MKELVEVIATSLVDHPEEVVVTETVTDKSIVLELKVAPDDMGKVIGKQGRIAKAIRTVVKSAASKDDKKVIVEILQFWKGFGLSEYAAAFCVIDDLIEISHGIIFGNFSVLYIKEGKRWKNICA